MPIIRQLLTITEHYRNLMRVLMNYLAITISLLLSYTIIASIIIIIKTVSA